MNNQIFRENMEVLSQTYVDIAKHIEEYNIEKQKDILVSSIETKDKNYAVVVKKGEMEYRLNSLYSPLKEVDRWVNQFEFQAIQVLITMFGLGNGYFVRALRKRMEKKARLLVYEPDIPILYHVIQQYDIRDILEAPDILLIVKDINDQQMYSLYNSTLDAISFANQLYCVHPKYDILYSELYKKILEEVKQAALRQQIDRNTEAFFADSCLKNNLKNMSYLKESHILSQYEGKFDIDIPAIVVSAGPSLDKNVEKLKKAKGKAVIIAVDSALKYILEKDIIPDFTITVDPNKPMRCFRNSKSLEIPIICKFESNRVILGNHKARKIFYGSELFLRRMYQQLGKKTMVVPEAGGSVATCATAVCRDLGFKRIILVGQDLAYSGNVSYAGGDSFPIAEEAYGIAMVDGIIEEKVKTRRDWHFFLKWYENFIIANPDITLIDATEGGAKIHGSLIMTLEEAIQKYCKKEIDCKMMVEEMKPTLNIEELEQARVYFKKGIEDIDKVKEEVKKGIKICETMLKACENRKEKKGFLNVVKKLEQINFDINSKNVYQLIDLYISTFVLKDMFDVYDWSEDNMWLNHQKTFEKTMFLYKEIEKACDVIKERLGEVVF